MVHCVYVQAGISDIESDDNCLDPDIAVAELSRKLESLGALKEMSSLTKELHSSVTKLNKVLLGPTAQLCLLIYQAILQLQNPLS